MIRRAGKITVSGTLKEKGQIHLDEVPPLDPGRVEVTVRPVGQSPGAAGRKLSLLDLAGSARKLLKGVDVDEQLDDLRNEWDRKTP